MSNVFSTAKLPQAAYLKAKGIRLLRCESIRPGHCEFCFDDPDGRIEELASGYYSGGVCEAMEFYRAILDLKVSINQTIGRSFPATGGVNRG